MVKKYQEPVTVNRVSIEEKALSVIKESQSFKALISTFKDDGVSPDVTVFHATFTRVFPTQKSEVVKVGIGEFARVTEGTPIGEVDKEYRDRVKERNKYTDLVVDKSKKEVYRE